MILIINKNIKQGVSILKNSNSEIQWLKLCKTFFDLNKDIYVCFVYMHPSNSSYAVRHNLFIMGILCFDVMNYGKLGFLVICGDFNARTARETSCLSKVFNSILNTSLQKYLDSNNIINKVQIGFQPKSRTSDHIFLFMFILRTSIQKYTNNKS